MWNRKRRAKERHDGQTAVNHNGFLVSVRVNAPSVFPLLVTQTCSLHLQRVESIKAWMQYFKAERILRSEIRKTVILFAESRCHQST